MGAKGANADGDIFFYGFNENSDDALLVILSENGERYTGWEGVAELVEDHVVLKTNDTEVPYIFSDVDEDGRFTMTFLGDNDVAEMQLIDVDDFISELVANRMEFA